MLGSIFQSGQIRTPYQKDRAFHNVSVITSYSIHYTKLYDSILRQNLAQLLDESKGPLVPFRNDPIRIILRPTQFYANFLMEANHPNYTKDAIERENRITSYNVCYTKLLRKEEAMEHLSQARILLDRWFRPFGTYRLERNILSQIENQL